MTHPEHCRGCRGSGYRPGPPIVSTMQGRRHVHTTVTPCEHHFWDDDPDSPLHAPVATTSPIAKAEHAAGYERGQHDLWHLSGGQLGIAPAPRSEEF